MDRRSLTITKDAPTVRTYPFGLIRISWAKCGRTPHPYPTLRRHAFDEDLERRVERSVRISLAQNVNATWRTAVSLGTILLIILILILIGALPTWPHSRSWGYFPSGAVGVIVIILIILLILGRI